MKPTFGEILGRNRGFGPGFDFARVVLALSVLATHVSEIAQGTNGFFQDRGFWIYDYSILPMFFGLSGFLVAGSAQRLSLANFAINRGLRIFPALAVEIFLSALIVGPIFTDLTLHDYFRNKEFFVYFLNSIGLIHYRLPGVFTVNPTPTVNGSLWTVPYEIMCYIAMAIMISTGFVKRASLFVWFAVAIVTVSALGQFVATLLPGHAFLQHYVASYVHGGRGPALVPCFLLGAAVYIWRDRIAYDRRIFITCILFTGAIGLLATPKLWEFTPAAFLICPMMIYIVCFVGLSDMPRLPYFSNGDYSYGIYLYAFPIQQVLISLFPVLHSWPLHFVASVVCATLFATFSWHLIEKPILGMRKHFSFAARLEKERHREAS